jgi:hypothetical protein
MPLFSLDHAMSDSPEMGWLVEDRVRLLRLPKHFSTEAFQTYDRETCDLLETLPHPLFHVILDVRIVESFPPLSVCLGMRSIRHPRVGWILSVGAAKNALMRFFLSAVVGATRIRYKDCQSLEEAMSFLSMHDPALPQIETWAAAQFEGDSA